jgi:hypothetical protein
MALSFGRSGMAMEAFCVAMIDQAQQLIRHWSISFNSTQKTLSRSNAFGCLVHKGNERKRGLAGIIAKGQLHELSIANCQGLFLKDLKM